MQDTKISKKNNFETAGKIALFCAWETLCCVADNTSVTRHSVELKPIYKRVRLAALPKHAISVLYELLKSLPLTIRFIQQDAFRVAYLVELLIGFDTEPEPRFELRFLAEDNGTPNPLSLLVLCKLHSNKRLPKRSGRC